MTVAPAQCMNILLHQCTIARRTPTARSLPCGDGLLDSDSCPGGLLRCYDRRVGNDNVFELVLRDGIDGVCVCEQ